MPKVSFKTIDSVDVSGKRVLVRVDLNVPMKNGQVTDATRIERAAPTLAELAAKGAKVIVLSHFGRPDGKRVPEMSLKPLVEPLSKALGKPVAFAEDCIGPLAENAVGVLKPGDVLLLENLRFHKEEEKNDAGFIDKLSVLGDVYVNDAFSAAHRAQVRSLALSIACDIHPLGNLRVLNYLRSSFHADENAVNAWAGEWIGLGFKALEQRVQHTSGDGRHMFGSEVTLADLCIVPQMYNALRYQLDVEPYPALRAICAHLEALPAFARAAPRAQPDAPPATP